ncbi:hypothetical protein ACQ4PT_046884 [Festuca glaucescens]
MDGTHGPMEEDTDGKLMEVPKVNVEVKHTNGTKRDNDRLDSILQVDLPSRGEARCLVEEDFEEDNAKVPQVKHANLKDEAPVEKDSKENPNADGKDLPEKEVDESKEAEEQQGETLTSEYMHVYIEEIILAEQLDGQRETLTKIDVEGNPEEITRAQGKQFDDDTMHPWKNSVDCEMLFSSASIESKEDYTEVVVEDVIEKQFLQDVELINERESLSDGAAMEIQGGDDHKTLDIYDVMLEKQDKGTTYENTERTLVDTDASECGEAEHGGTMKMIHETDSTVQAVNKISFKNKQNPALLEKQDKESTDENTVRTLVDTDAPECGEAEHDGTMKMIHETDSTVQAVNMAADIISSKNKQDLAVVEKQDKELTDENTVRTLVDTDAPECGEAEHDGSMKMIVLEKQDEARTNENTERTLVDTVAPECGEAKYDGTMKMIHETGSAVQAVNMAEDKNLFKNKQNLTVLEKQDMGTIDENTERTLVDTNAPECGEANHDGTMKMIYETDSIVQAVNMAENKISFRKKQKVVPVGDHDKSDAEGSGSNQTARKEFKGDLQLDFEREVEVQQENVENKTEMSGGRKNDEASEQEQTSIEDATIAPSGIENNNELAEEPIKSYGKYASDPVNTGCQTSKVGRPSIEEVRRIHSGRSIYLKDIKESQGKIRSEPSNRTHINNAVSVCGRDRALELVTGPPEETPRWRQEQYALNILEDVQNARIAEKTKMEMEIRILKAQIVSMQKQVMNMDHAGEVISR